MSLVVTSPAEDPKLLTIEQMRVAAGLADSDDSQDGALQALNAQISADICDACRIAVAGSSEPTLRRETLIETFALGPAHRRKSPAPLVLSRRHDVEVLSITVGEQPLLESEFSIEAEAGLVWRLGGGVIQHWTGTRVTVTYEAGFDEVPVTLRGAALDLVRLRRSEMSRDPLVKRQIVDVDGIDRTETEFWVTAGSSSNVASPIPPQIMASLRRFYNSAFA